MPDLPLPTRARSVCPHDCPSACALDVELPEPGRPEPGRIGRIHGHAGNPYTAGVVCAKVARYAERLYHPKRLTQPLKRVGAKGDGAFVPVSWDDALDSIAEAFTAAAARHGPESVWPYYYGGTMGLVQRNAANRLRYAMGYSGQVNTVCVTAAEAGWKAGFGAVWGSESRMIAESDLVVMWGGNPVSTQVNLMTHITRARKMRGAKLVVVDVYRTPTADVADRVLILRPGTDAALACAVMHCAFRDGWADLDFLTRLTDFPADLRAHLAARTPAWAAAITGLSVAEIEDFAALYGRTERAFLRLGFGFSRSGNGAAQMHAVSCLPAVGGKWRHPGGGALWEQYGRFAIDRTWLQASDLRDPTVRALDMCRIGAVLGGDAEALKGGPPVTAMLVQSSNPAMIAPESNRVRAGLARADLFLAVHEQMPTETVRYADIVLPATMFLEHDDIYTAGAHTWLQIGAKLIDPPGACRSNHQMIADLAARLGARHPSFAMTAWDLIEDALRRSGLPDAGTIKDQGGYDVVADRADESGFAAFPQPDGKFRFAPDWAGLGADSAGLPRLPDHAGDLLEAADADHPFRLVTAPARNFLNTSFNDTPSSLARETRPCARLHPDDLAELGIADGDLLDLGNRRGRVRLHALAFAGVRRGVVIVESQWAATGFVDGSGINCLTRDTPIPPAGGGAFHDCAIWVRAVGAAPMAATG